MCKFFWNVLDSANLYSDADDALRTTTTMSTSSQIGNICVKYMNYKENKPDFILFFV